MKLFVQKLTYPPPHPALSTHNVATQIQLVVMQVILQSYINFIFFPENVDAWKKRSTMTPNKF